MNTFKMWLSHRYAKSAKVAIVSIVIGLFAHDIVVAFIGPRLMDDLFGNGKGIAILVLALVIGLFLAYKPFVNRNPGNNPQSFPRS